MKYVLSFILGIAATFLMWFATPYALHGLHQDCWKCKEAALSIGTLNQAVDWFYSENGRFPTTDEGLEILIEKDIIKKLSLDPWGGEFLYSLYNTSKYMCYLIWSLGSDAKTGGVKEHEIDIHRFSKGGNCLDRRPL